MKSWEERKAFFTDYYARMFAVGMKKWPRRCYIEPFAGPGLSSIGKAQKFVTGSALRAMEHPFTDFYFADLDSTAINALTPRAEARSEGRRLWIRQRDCNAAVDEIATLVPPNAISLAFIDPEAAQIRFSAVERLASLPRMDLLFTFHIGAFRRAKWTLTAKQIDAFFPPGADWREAVRGPMEEQIRALLALYRAGLEPYGYRPEFAPWVTMRNSRNALMYVLALFTKHPRGLDFWQKAVAAEQTGQLRLDLQ